METEDATTPAAGEGMAQDQDVEVATEATAQTDDQATTDEALNPEAGDGQTEDEQAEAEAVEIEHEGQKYKVPAPLKEAFLRNADYTQKTQALAEQRRAVEDHSRSAQAQIEAAARQAEVVSEMKADIGKVEVIRTQLANFDGIDWTAAIAEAAASEDPARSIAGVMAAQAQFNTLKTALGEAEQGLSAKQQQLEAQFAQAQAAAMADTVKVLEREIPGWSPEVVRGIVTVGQEFGFAPEDFGQMNDPRAWKGFHALAAARAENETLKAQLARKTTTERHAASQQTQPAKTVSSKSGGYKPGLDDSLPPDEWRRRREAQRNRARA